MANKFKTFKCYQHFSDEVDLNPNKDERRMLIHLFMEGSGSEQEQYYAEIYHDLNFKKPEETVVLKTVKQLNFKKAFRCKQKNI